MIKREWQRYERLQDVDWDQADALRDAIRELYLSPVACCVRAGFDCAVKPSMGAMGFTAGDIRRMYPEGVSDWVTNGEWETLGVKDVVPGIGFVPEPKGDWHPFDSIARPRPVHNAFIAAVMGSEKNIGTSILDDRG